jgi:hypothetical protein
MMSLGQDVLKASVRGPVSEGMIVRALLHLGRFLADERQRHLAP